MVLKQIAGNYSIARYAPDAAMGPLFTREFCSITRTKSEVTVVCETEYLPAGMQKKEDGWVCLQIEGLLDFNLTGILNQITGPLAAAEVSLFAVSTFDTDYVLVKKSFLKAAVKAMEQNGITVEHF